MPEPSPSKESRLERLLDRVEDSQPDSVSEPHPSEEELYEDHPASRPEPGQEPSDEQLEEAVEGELDRRLSMYEDLRAAEIEKARQERQEREAQATPPGPGDGSGPEASSGTGGDDDPPWEKKEPIDRLADRDMGPSRWRRWGRHALVGATVGAVMTMTMFVRDFNESIELDCPDDAPVSTAPASGHQEAFDPVSDIFTASAGHALQIYRSDRGDDFKKGAQVAHRMLIDQSRTIIKDPQARAAMVAASLEWARAQPDQDFIRYTGDLLEHPDAATDSRVAGHLAPVYASIHAQGTADEQVMEENPDMARSMRYMARINEAHAQTQCHVLPTGGFTPQMHERLEKAIQAVEANRPHVSDEFAQGFNQTLSQARSSLSQHAPTQSSRTATR